MDSLESELAGPPAIEAELVVATPEKKPKRRGHTFSEVVMLDIGKQYRQGQLSEREIKFLAMYLKTGSVMVAAQEVGISRITGHRYLQRPPVKKYVDHMRARVAKAADLTLDKVAAVIGEAVDGRDITPLQLQAAGMAAKFLAPARGPGVQVNVQNNFNSSSPFAGLEQKAMLDEIKRNLLEMGQ